MKYYIDTAIYRDLHENRIDKFRPLGEWAFEAFTKIRMSNSIIVYSDLIIEEISVAYDEEIIEKLFKNKELVKVQIKKKQVKEASKLSRYRKLPFGDCLHAVIARDANAILVSRDKHFYDLIDIVECKKPEEL